MEWDEDYFISPLNIPLQLSGTFGELRGSHFHAGYDFRTRGREGFETRAAADGYISRISVSPVGYGHSLYITHPNGLKTVYAHLKDFHPDIKELVRKEQFRQESFRVRIHPSRNKFPVEQGELIGWTGNSGSSGGPHLHFEVRKASTQEPINPSKFNFPVEDNFDPIIKAIQIHPLTPESTVRIRRGNRTETRRYQPALIELSNLGGRYRPANANNIMVSGPVGISVETIDHQLRGGNPLGVKSVKMKKNGDLFYDHAKKRFSFAQTRFIQAHVDHAARTDKRRSFQRLFLLPNNPLPFYNTVKNNGRIELDDEDTAEFSIEVKDGFDNNSLAEFSIDAFQPPLQTTQELRPVYDQMMPYQSANYFRNEHLHVSFPRNSFYDTLYFSYQKEYPYSKAFSHRHHIHDKKDPVHHFFTITINPVNLPEKLKEKAFIARINDNESFSYAGNDWTDGKLRGRSRVFGKYEIRVDTVAPRLSPINFTSGNNIASLEALHFRVRDNVSGIDKYRAEINGNWALAEYDPKNNLLSIPLDQRLPQDDINLKLRIEDKVGNTRLYHARLKN